MARPSSLTNDEEEKITAALRTGNTRTAAAAHAGVSYDSFKRWLDRDAEFAAAIARAEADAEVRSVAHIARAARDGHWQAAAWWLERRRPED